MERLICRWCKGAIFWSDSMHTWLHRATGSEGCGTTAYPER